MQQQHRASAHRSPYLQQPRNQMVLPAQLQQQGAVGAMGAQVLPAQLQQQDMGLHTPLTIEAETLRDHQAVLMQQQLRARHFEQQQRQAAVEQQQQLQRQHRLLTQQQQQQHQHQALMASSGQPDVFADRVSLPDMGPAAQLQSLPALLQQQAAMLQQQGHAQAAAGALDLQGSALLHCQSSDTPFHTHGLGLTAGLGTAALPTSQRHATLNLKLFDTSPDLLPPNLRHHFDIMLQQNATFMEASMRAGCVHIILTVLVRGEPAKWNIESLARRLLSCGRYWRRLQMLIQLPASALLLKAGVVQRTWEAAKLQGTLPKMLFVEGGSCRGTASQQGCRAAAPARGTPAGEGKGHATDKGGVCHCQPVPVCMVAGRAIKVVVRTRLPVVLQGASNPSAHKPVKLLARYGGEFVVNPDLEECPRCNTKGGAGGWDGQDAAVQGGDRVVCLTLPALEGEGVLFLEPECGGFLGKVQPVVVVTSELVKVEVEELVGQLTLGGGLNPREARQKWH
eukprot:jgi/Astpho2/1482/Aster-x0062